MTFRRLLTLSDFQVSLAVSQYLSLGLFLYYSVLCLYTFSDFSYHSVTARFAKHLKSVIFRNVTSKTTQSSGVCYDLTGPLTRKKVFAANKRLFSAAQQVKMMHYQYWLEIWHSNVESSKVIHNNHNAAWCNEARTRFPISSNDTNQIHHDSTKDGFVNSNVILKIGCICFYLARSTFQLDSPFFTSRGDIFSSSLFSTRSFQCWQHQLMCLCLWKVK